MVVFLTCFAHSIPLEDTEMLHSKALSSVNIQSFEVSLLVPLTGIALDPTGNLWLSDGVQYVPQALEKVLCAGIRVRIPLPEQL